MDVFVIDCGGVVAFNAFQQEFVGRVDKLVFGIVFISRDNGGDFNIAVFFGAVGLNFNGRCGLRLSQFDFGFGSGFLRFGADCVLFNFNGCGFGFFGCLGFVFFIKNVGVVFNDSCVFDFESINFRLKFGFIFKHRRIERVKRGVGELVLGILNLFRKVFCLASKLKPAIPFCQFRFFR